MHEAEDLARPGLEWGMHEADDLACRACVPLCGMGAEIESPQRGKMDGVGVGSLLRKMQTCHEKRKVNMCLGKIDVQVSPEAETKKNEISI